MFKSKKIITLTLAAALFAGQAYAAKLPKTEEELKDFIIKTVMENPHAVINVLMANPEMVLETAQNGSKKLQIIGLKNQWIIDKRTTKEIRTEGRPVLGDKKAAITMVQFTNFNCPHCKSAKATMNGLLQEHKDIKLVLKFMPLEPTGPSITAAKWYHAIAQQNPEQALHFYDTVTDNIELLQKDGENYLKKVVETLAIDKGKFAQAIFEDTAANKMLQEDREDAEKLGISGTPCFVINNVVIRGALPPEFFKEALNIALAKETPEPEQVKRFEKLINTQKK
ncbi:MAG: thioredoxin domain-containing protein [Lachnospiraceae bacterium]|nr:thioredoxin domain-containing protein [Lachnospiraceae bacterium]